MVFSSVVFVCCFLPLLILLYYLLPGNRLRNILLLLASLFFYAWGGVEYLSLILISITGNYLFGILCHSCKKNRNLSKLWLCLGILFNLGLLFYYKYFGFTIKTIGQLLNRSWTKNIVLPIGISFYTFQGLSYIIDVYREDTSNSESVIVQTSWIKLALYISMFPQLIAGPIVRYRDIRPYLDQRKTSLAQFAEGAEIFIRGLGKKVIFSNILGETATQIMETHYLQTSPATAWLGALCYMMQIFYDFSGYSDMAVGLGKLFGFELMENFRYPYISKSITEFWRRWHISLSQWFKDYLYIPLGGNRKGNVYINLSIVFLATGIWHGASWGFILWGMWHGVFILFERYMKNHDITFHVPSIFKWLYTMLVVYFGWILFRIVSVSSSIEYIRLMFGRIHNNFIPYDLSWYFNKRVIFILPLAIFCCFPWKNTLTSKFSSIKKLCETSFYLVFKRIILIGILILCFLFITNSTYNPFIYFRF